MVFVWQLCHADGFLLLFWELRKTVSRTRGEGIKNSVPHFCSAPDSSIRVEAKARPNSQVTKSEPACAWCLHHRAHGPWPASSSSHGALLDYVPTRVEVIVNLRKQNLSKFM
jgi:hypothetical protein